MPVSKVKSIAILLLVLVNAFLLALVVPSHVLQQRQLRQTQTQLENLFQAQGITLDAARLPKTPALQALTVTYTADLTLSAARALLGDEVLLEEDSAQYLSRFASSSGSFSIDRSGSFSAAFTGRVSVSDPTADAKKLLGRMGIETNAVTIETTGDLTTVTATQALQQAPVFPAAIKLIYRDGVLTAMEGTLYLGTLTLADTRTLMSCSDALSAFLGSRESLSFQGSTILRAVPCYTRSGTAAAATVRLDPTWRLETDDGMFLVNGITGTVVRS